MLADFLRGWLKAGRQARAARCLRTLEGRPGRVHSGENHEPKNVERTP